MMEYRLRAVIVWLCNFWIQVLGFLLISSLFPILFVLFPMFVAWDVHAVSAETIRGVLGGWVLVCMILAIVFQQEHIKRV